MVTDRPPCDEDEDEDEYEDESCAGLRGCPFDVEWSGFSAISTDGTALAFAVFIESTTREANYGTLRVDWIPISRADPQHTQVYPEIDDCAELLTQTRQRVAEINARLEGSWRPLWVANVNSYDHEPTPGERLMYIEQKSVIVELDGQEIVRFRAEEFSQFDRAETIYIAPDRPLAVIEVLAITAGHDDNIVDHVVIPLTPEARAKLPIVEQPEPSSASGSAVPRP